MQFFAVTTALFASLALAAPATEQRQVYIPCSGLYGSAQCCATDVLGIANLDCGQPPDVPADPAAFQATCATIGQRARCCVLPILDQGILCNNPAGVEE
ncbi:hypothetical protein ACHAQA_007025 [Verticillium albo-atrum]